MIIQFIIGLAILLYGVALLFVVRLSRLRWTYSVPVIVIMTMMIIRLIFVIHERRSDSNFEGPPVQGAVFDLVIAALFPVMIHRVITLLRAMENTRHALQAARDELEQRVIDRTSDLAVEISERARVATALSATENQMRLVVQNLPVMVTAIDDQHQFAIWNREAERITGYSAVEMVCNPDAFMLLYPDADYRAQQIELFDNASSAFRDLEVLLTGKDGRQRVIAWSNVSQQYPIPGWRSWAIGVDVTERKQAEQALHQTRETLEQKIALRTTELRTANEQLEREIVERRRAVLALARSENQLRSTLDALRDYVYVINKDLEITLVNKAFLAWNQDFGLETQPLGRTPHELFPFLSGHLNDEYRQVFASGQMITTEETNQIGTLKIVTETRKIPIIESGEVTHVVTIMRDISERKQAEEALRQSEERFKRLYERAPLGYQSLDHDGYFVQVNQAWLHLLGYERVEVIGRWFGDFLTPPYRDRFRHGFSEFKAEGEVRAVEFEMERKDGTTITVLIDGKIGYDAQGQIAETHCILVDITDRKRTEVELQASEERFRSLVDSMDDIIVTLDTDQHHTGIFGRRVKKTGLSPTLLLGKTARDVFGREIAAIHEAANARALVGEHVVFEWSAPDPEGIMHYYQTSLSPMFNPNGDVTGLVGVGRDITALKNAQQDAIRGAVERERAQILAGFIRDVSHEFANPISVVKNSIYLAVNTPDPAQRKRHLDMLSGQVFHIEQLVEGMILMSRLDGGIAFKHEPVYFDAIFDTIKTRLQQTTQAKEQTLAIELKPDLPPFMGDQNYLHIAIFHLIQNAVQYTPNGGTIAVRLAESSSHPDHLVITVADTGIGIAAEYQTRIFERFFRIDRARTERGAGLGLPIAQSIIERHGGSLT
ncbi:MAG: PAS domain S-box protein, partial [Anaerolineae bacterium]|nr:PAS domain S-box protein [Anaerolineae bacterium]